MEVAPVLEAPKDVPRSDSKFTAVRNAFTGFMEQEKEKMAHKLSFYMTPK